MAGAYGITELTMGFAKAKDDLGKFSEVFSMVPADVAALGAAIQSEGGSFEGMISQLKQIEELRAGLRVGDVGFIRQAGIAGLNVGEVTSAKSAVEAYVNIADQFQRMTPQARINAAKALGLDEASIRLLSKGSDYVRDMMEEMNRLRPITQEMIEEAAEFNNQLLLIQQNAGGIADKFSNYLVPKVTESMKALNDYMGKNRPWWEQRIGATWESVYSAGIEPVAEMMITPGEVADTIENAWNSEPVKEQRRIWNKTFGDGDTPGAAGERMTRPGRSADQGNAQSPIQVQLVLDGQVIDQRIITVTEQQARQALDDIDSSVDY